MADPMKLTNIQVLESLAALAALGQIKLPAKAAYAVAKATNKLADLEKPIRTVQRTLWEKYATKGEDGKVKVGENGSLTIPAANNPAFSKEHAELLECMNEVNGLRVVTLAELDGCQVEPAVLVHLDWFIKDEA